MFSSFDVVDGLLKFAEPVTTMGSSPNGSRSRNFEWTYATCELNARALAFVSSAHGVLAPNAKLRAAIVPQPAQNASAPSPDLAQAPGSSAAARISWARLLKGVFAIDIEHCAHCGGTLKIIAAIEDPAVIVAILTHLGLPARAPPRSPARALPLFQAA